MEALARCRGYAPVSSGMRRFRLYREAPPDTYISGGYANPPDVPQLEGVVFSDGTVAVRWLTLHHSTSLWDSFETFDIVHGHPEYKTRLVWLDVEAK